MCRCLLCAGLGAVDYPVEISLSVWAQPSSRGRQMETDAPPLAAGGDRAVGQAGGHSAESSVTWK